MKKTIIAFMCFALSLLFVACSVSATSPNFTSRKPWQLTTISKSNREYMEFSATRYSYTGNTPTAIAEGSLVFSLREVIDKPTSLSTELTLTHNASSDFEGKVDSISSLVSFDAVSLQPVSSYKKLDRRSLTVEKGFTATTDYQAQNTTIAPILQPERQYTLKGSGYFDNEQLYHLVRAIPSLTTSKTYTLDILTPFDVYENDSFGLHTLTITTASEIMSIEVAKEIYDMAIPRSSGDSGKLDDNGVFSIDCLAVRIELDAVRKGPPIYMYLSDLVFIDNQTLREDESIHATVHTSRVPVKITTAEYNTSNTLIFSNEYNLISYSTMK